MANIFNKKEYSNQGIRYTSVCVERDISISTVYHWHPGVPGYDLKFNFEVTLNNVEGNNKYFTLTCDDQRVKVNKTEITIPEEVRNSKPEIKVNVAYKTDDDALDYDVIVPLKSWEITFNDDFDGDTLNTDVWKSHRNHLTYDKPEDADTYEVIDRAQVAPNCYTVSDSMLNMLVTDDVIYDPINKQKYLYSECCLDTRESFLQKYGCFSARIACAKFGGINTAFWLLPLGKYSTKYHNFKCDNNKIGLAEIDILESSAVWGEGNRFAISEHYYDFTNDYAHISEGQYYEVEDKMTNFHVFTCVWFEDSLYYYVNDKLLRATFGVSADGFGGEPVTEGYIIVDISLYLDNSWVGKRNFTKEDLPIKAQVDWVRAYK